MSKYLDKNNKIILQLLPPEVKIRMVLKNLNFSEHENIFDLSFENKRIIFLVSFREFLKGNLLLEEFSEVASLLKMSFDINSRTDGQADYELMIYEAADLSLYVRKNEDPEKSTFAGFMNTIWKYFNKYKYLLNNVHSEYPVPSSLEI